MYRLTRDWSAAVLLGAMMVVPSAFASPQDAGAPAAPTAEGTGSGVPDPQAAAENCLRENGFTQGYSKEKGVFAVVVSASMPCGPDNQAFADCRNAAFQKAMLDAKKQIAEFLAAEISSYVKSVVTEPELADPMIKDMGGNAAAELVKNSAEGTDAQKKLLTSEQFASSVNVVARQEVAAVQCFQSFESVSADGKSIAVVAIMSPKSVQMAKAMLGQAPEGVKGKAKEPISDWVSKIESEGMLLFTYGVIQRTNENGELCLVAFGQSSPRTTAGASLDAAYDKARLQAQQALRQFAGELVASEADMTTGSTLKAFSDNTQEFSNDSSFKQTIEAVAKKLTLPGISQVKRAKVNHPLVSGVPTAIVVLEWNASSADAAQELKSTLDAMRGSEGGVGRSGMKKEAPKKAAPVGAPKPKQEGDGRGAPGSADDT